MISGCEHEGSVPGPHREDWNVPYGAGNRVWHEYGWWCDTKEGACCSHCMHAKVLSYTQWLLLAVGWPNLDELVGQQQDPAHL